MYIPLILTIIVIAVVAVLILVLIRNRKDRKALEASLDAAEDEEGLRAHSRPGERKEL